MCLLAQAGDRAVHLVTRRVSLALAVVVLAATSAWAQVTLTVDLTGSGGGTVTSAPAGINCTGASTTCTAAFAAGTVVTLTQAAQSGHTFGGWGGACVGVGGCVVTAGPGRLVAATFGGTPTYQFYHQDAIGSVRAITDETGITVTRHDYEPFGEEATTVGDRIGFGGKELDGESAQHYFGARYYRNVTGRFTTVDPVMNTGKAMLEPQLWNRYAYVTNNPLRYHDPDGRQRAEIMLEQDIQALMAGRITESEYSARIEARGAGAAIGAAVGTLVLGGPTVWRAAVGCALSPSCQTEVGQALQELAGGPPVLASVRVIGKYPGYLDLADQLGAKRFNVPAEVWEAMSVAERLAANNKFLDRGIAAGAAFRSTVRIADILSGKERSWLRHEVEYLLDAGYRVSEDGYTLIPR